MWCEPPDAGTTKPAATRSVAVVIAIRLCTYRFPALGGQHPAEPFLEPDFGLPPQHLARTRDVRLADLRIVDGERLEHDLALRRRDPDDGLRKFEQRKLGRVAEVHGQVLVARREQVEPTDHVLHVAEAPRLR